MEYISVLFKKQKRILGKNMQTFNKPNRKKKIATEQIFIYLFHAVQEILNNRIQNSTLQKKKIFLLISYRHLFYLRFLNYQCYTMFQTPCNHFTSYFTNSKFKILSTNIDNFQSRYFNIIQSLCIWKFFKFFYAEIKHCYSCLFYINKL